MPEQKDDRGRFLINKLCKPMNPNSPIVTWNEDPDLLEELYEYCRQDVRTERAFESQLMALPASEQQIYEIDLAINQRGIHVDLPLVHACEDLAAIDKADAEDCIADLTKGAIRTPGQISEMLDWLALHGLALKDMKAETLDRAIETAEGPVREMLMLRKRYAKTSTAKLKPLKNSTGGDSRIRGTILYYGAERTGRFAGRRVQPHNLPRPVVVKTPEMAEDVIPLVLHGDLERIEEYGAPMQVISDLIRPCLTAAPGNLLLGADFAAVEARVLAWLADQRDALDVFRSGEDIYMHAADSCDSTDRQFGKVQVLGLGYGMGAGTFIHTAAGYGIDMADLFGFWFEKATQDQVEKAKKTIHLLGRGQHPWERWFPAEMTKWTWRENNAQIVSFWYDVEAAAHSAIRKPGSLHRAGPVAFMLSGTTLLCRLPSGRLLCYPFASLALRKTPWDEVKDTLRYRGLDDKNQWTWIFSYGGKLVENITQAVARDLLCYALVQTDAKGFPVVLHVHDEIVAEVPEADADRLDEFVSTMEITPPWAHGFPSKAEGWCGFRFGKR
jgi:DNA polymerase